MREKRTRSGAQSRPNSVLPNRRDSLLLSRDSGRLPGTHGTPARDEQEKRDPGSRRFRNAREASVDSKSPFSCKAITPEGPPDCESGYLGIRRPSARSHAWVRRRNPQTGVFGTRSGPNMGPKKSARKWPICRHFLRHRYRDSNPGFRTENPIREASLGRFGDVWAHLGQWSAVEFAGVGDIFRDTVLDRPRTLARERRRR
jgi:hypothetical protein